MKSSSCSIKLLEKAYIGAGVRMTSGKKTVPFDNVPMKDVTIIDYNNLGFHLSHSSLPKTVWVDFMQLPLTELTIVNGVIKDEITFVENIVVHEMEFIKTDMLDYLELLDIKEREKEKRFVTLKEIKPGDVVVSSLCESGEPMIYLGTWFTKEVKVKIDYWYNYHGNGKDDKCEYYLLKNSPARAFFLVKEQNGNKYIITDFSVTSKQILNLVSKETSIFDFRDLNFNKNLVFYHINNTGYNLKIPGSKQNDVSKLVPNYHLAESYRSYAQFLTDTKESINENARIFIEDKFDIKLEKELR